MTYDRAVLISDSHRMLFVHVQKTGGVSIQHMLEAALPDARKLRPPNRHATLTEILEREPAVVDYWSFGFVRNPWSRLVSWYDMVRRLMVEADRGWKGSIRHLTTNPFLGAVARDYPTFDDFVLRGPDEWERLRTPQIDYLRTPNRTVDFIGRTESLSADIRHVFAHLGLPEPEEVLRKNTAEAKPDWRERYTPATRSRVAEIFAPDLELFGYEF
ncbi:sulfotransferase family 2 domain-containing protein [Nocardioides pacificus]